MLQLTIRTAISIDSQARLLRICPKQIGFDVDGTSGATMKKDPFTGHMKRENGYRVRYSAEGWSVPADSEEQQQGHARGKKGLRRSAVKFGAALAVIAVIAFLALSREGAKQKPEGFSLASSVMTTTDPDTSTPENVRRGNEMVPGLGKLADVVPGSIPAAPSQPASDATPSATAAVVMPSGGDAGGVPTAGAKNAPDTRPVAESPATARRTTAQGETENGQSQAGEKASGDRMRAQEPPVALAIPSAPARKPVSAQKPLNVPVPVTQGNVTRMRLAARMQGLEPGAAVDLPIRISRGQARTIYFFTELHGLAGRSIAHRWEWEGRVVRNGELRPASQSWRAYTAQAVIKPGRWRVTAVDTATGKVLAEQRFEVK